jgi:hypothetical protein
MSSRDFNTLYNVNTVYFGGNEPGESSVINAAQGVDVSDANLNISETGANIVSTDWFVANQGIVVSGDSIVQANRLYTGNVLLESYPNLATGPNATGTNIGALAYQYTGTVGTYYTRNTTNNTWEAINRSQATGPHRSIQYNNSGAFDGSANLTFDASSNLIANGNVRIGSTAAPSHRLHVIGANNNIFGQTSTTQSSLTLADSSGSQKQAVVQLNGDNMDFLSIQQGVSFRPFRFNTADSTSKISIGTTSTNAVGGIHLSAAQSNRKIIMAEINNNEHQNFSFGYNTNTLRYQIPTTSSNHGFYVGTSSTGSEEIMRISGNGGVQIGGPAYQQFPAGRLNILSTGALFDVGGAWTNQWLVVGTTSAGASSAIGLGFNSASNYGCLSCISPGVAYRDIRYCGARHLFFNGTTTTMNIGTAGDVLIGQQSTANLAITKAALGAAAPNTVVSAYYLKIGGTEYRTNSLRLIGLGYQGSSFQPAYIGYLEDTQTANSYGSIIFGTRTVTTDTAPLERMRISPTGYVGINTQTPSEYLEVSGNVSIIGGGIIKFPTGNLSINQGVSVAALTGAAAMVNNQVYPFNLTEQANTNWNSTLFEYTAPETGRYMINVILAVTSTAGACSFIIQYNDGIWRTLQPTVISTSTTNICTRVTKLNQGWKVRLLHSGANATIDLTLPNTSFSVDELQ